MHNPLRRNRKIGLTLGGRVQNGIAHEKWSKIFTRTTWEKLSEGTSLRIIRENPSRDHFHPCQPNEILGVIRRLPGEVTKDLRAVILRRLPASDREDGVEARRRYSCVILNAFPCNMRSEWPKPPTAAEKRHFAPWCELWLQLENGWILQWDHEQVRRYYLYHLLLHEIGHINQPWFHDIRRRESFAENFALEWARRLGVI